MSLLSIIQDACDDGLPVAAPSIVISNTDENIKTLLQLANKEGRLQTLNFPWNTLVGSTTFTGVTSSRLQGALATLAPGFKYIVNNSIWDRTTEEPVYGAVSSSEWQRRLALDTSNSLRYAYRIQLDNLYIDPIPASADTFAFDYGSKFWVNDIYTGKEKFTADSDVSLIDEEIIRLGVIWRFRKAKGLDYADELAEYNQYLSLAKGRDGGRPILNMTRAPYGRLRPYPYVQEGNFTL